MEKGKSTVNQNTVDFFPCTIMGILSAAELTLGSFLHLFHIPFTGQLMSLNQCFWLNVSKNWSSDHSALKISFQVAALKMMSPVGKKLTPMIAILMQGALFDLGCLCFGSNFLGRLAGSILMSFWSFLQPFFIYVLLMGTSLFKIIDFFSDKLGVDVLAAFVVMILAKTGLAILVSVLAHVLSRSLIERYGAWLQRLEAGIKPQKPFKSRLKRFVRSPFLYSTVIVIVYLYCTVESTERFLRDALFYVCWMITVTYLLDLVQLRLAKTMNKVVTPP